MAKTKCPNAIWLRRVDDTHRQVIHIAVPCGRKTCKFCANEIRKSHFKRVAYTMQHRQDWKWFFVTTTGKSWWHDVDDKAGISLILIRKTWSKFRKRMARAMKGKMVWLRVYEQHKSGVYHVHFIVGTDNEWWRDDGMNEFKVITQKSKRKQKRKRLVTSVRLTTDRRSRWVKKHWFASGGGYQINLKEIVMGENAIAPIKYVVKYTVKSSTDTNRVVEYSRNFPKLGYEDKTKYDWLVIGSPPTPYEIEEWQRIGYMVIGERE